MKPGLYQTLPHPFRVEGRVWISEAVYGTNSFKFSECSDLLK